MFSERTSVGLDVHARSVVAAAIDGVTGEVTRTRLTPSYEHIQSWLRTCQVRRRWHTNFLRSCRPHHKELTRPHPKPLTTSHLRQREPKIV